ncbi:MAG: hypothetical protein K0B11_21005 [Mariniphaga sp.]|nr:hypothetical protein [Mariniphaga sp.]
MHRKEGNDAIANAVFDACGDHVFRMPLTPQHILAAMKNNLQLARGCAENWQQWGCCPLTGVLF